MNARKPRIRWLPEHVAMLGRVPDGEVAAAVGCSVGAVLYRRRGLGIPPWSGPYEHERKQAERVHALLAGGPRTAREVADALGMRHDSACRTLAATPGVRRSVEQTGKPGRPRYLWRLA